MERKKFEKIVNLNKKRKYYKRVKINFFINKKSQKIDMYNDQNKDFN